MAPNCPTSEGFNEACWPSQHTPCEKNSMAEEHPPLSAGMLYLHQQGKLRVRVLQGRHGQTAGPGDNLLTQCFASPTCCGVGLDTGVCQIGAAMHEGTARWGSKLC